MDLPEIAAPFKNARLSDAGLAFLLPQTSFPTVWAERPWPANEEIFFTKH
jgi:hypothetical protein